ncbi:hypothetical protein SAY86_026390 [Trapa natans]|uniref:Photosystem II 5 kDa protein, chloroplastic n=1 Tax=Trapa natans TaxID=22666 RepID=A0AAN7KDR4_TRANT|nr:hypothetical protein SAY86_026390 [Trapa natans]
MASMTAMTASFLACAVQPVSAPHRGMVVAKAAARAVDGEKASVELKNIGKAEESVNGRRDLVFAAASAAVISVAGAAFAEDDEPKSGTAEAKKKYSAVCVTMPTARICRK